MKSIILLTILALSGTIRADFITPQGSVKACAHHFKDVVEAVNKVTAKYPGITMANSLGVFAPVYAEFDNMKTACNLCVSQVKEIGSHVQNVLSNPGGPSLMAAAAGLMQSKENIQNECGVKLYELHQAAYSWIIGGDEE